MVALIYNVHIISYPSWAIPFNADNIHMAVTFMLSSALVCLPVKVLQCLNMFHTVVSLFEHIEQCNIITAICIKVV